MVQLKKCLLCTFLLALLSYSTGSFAAPNLQKRAEINAKKQGVDAKTEEGLAAARSFLRIDSTYYVGWMFQGLYLTERANDFSGYQQSVPVLQRALSLLTKDYTSELKLKTRDPWAYYAVQQYHVDYSTIAYYLFQALQNTNQNIAAFQLLQEVKAINLQKNWMLEPFNMMAWMMHRNRFYTQKQWPFLKNSIPENEQLAQQYLDSSWAKQAFFKADNDALFDEYYNQYELQSIYHYKSILYGYALNIDSAAHYFQLLEGTNAFPYNNHGTFLMVQGKFREALDEYEIAGGHEEDQKQLQEWAYYSSLIGIYQGKATSAALQLKERIAAKGSTPGFGWYQIALARALSYQGDLTASKVHLDKAKNFKELHIGTTLAETHYQWASGLLSFMNAEKELAQLQFEHRRWWFKPKVWWAWVKAKAHALKEQYLVTNQLVANPEKDEVLYKLLATESVVSWDELNQLFVLYNPEYFKEVFLKALKTDQRPLLLKYYHLLLANIDYQKGSYQLAKQRLEKVLQFTEDIDPSFEKLYLARIHETLAKCALELNTPVESQYHIQQVLQLYPSLLPYSGLRPQMRLRINQEGASIADGLERFNIDWVSSKAKVPEVILYLRSQKDTTTLEYSVVAVDGSLVVPKSSMSWNAKQPDFKGLAKALFGIVSFDAQTHIDQAH